MPSQTKSKPDNLAIGCARPLVSMDCIHAKVRGKDTIRLKLYTWPIRVNLNSMKEAMSLWRVKKEGAKFWLQLVTE